MTPEQEAAIQANMTRFAETVGLTTEQAAANIRAHLRDVGVSVAAMVKAEAKRRP